ncbi:MAG: S-methyl-5'-thioadenosine phosphorylase [Dehalococcoidia bacterium]|nr:MAG: S-methyl-5'-thioadenosine phosphorylase [Dehalococcoidia bacterium]
MPAAKIGVIGGTGLDEIEGMTDIETVDVNTPFGKPSDRFTIGNLGNTKVAFLRRHGRGHYLTPGEVPGRANIYAFKSLGVEHIIAVCSCGSFKPELKPGDLIIPDQLVDRTRKRVTSFFKEGIVAHIQFADPFCPATSKILYESAKESGAKVHEGGIYVCMEGPAFSTRAESRLYKSWGADVIGMTALPEAQLAREAEICYGVIACVTDYDSWHEAEEPVTIDMVLATMRRNIETAKQIIKLSVTALSAERTCQCAHALQNAVVTAKDVIPVAQKEKLSLLIGKYL